MSHLEDIHLGGSNSSNVTEQPGIAEVADQSRAGGESSPSHGSQNIHAPTTRSTNANKSVISGDESSSRKMNNDKIFLIYGL